MNGAIGGTARLALGHGGRTGGNLVATMNQEGGVAFNADGKRTAIVLQADLHHAVVAAGGFLALGDGRL